MKVENGVGSPAVMVGFEFLSRRTLGFVALVWDDSGIFNSRKQLWTIFFPIL